MDLRHLRTFVVLSEELHFARAAKRLRMAQSGVSQNLKALEHELGGPLLVRTRGAVGLTPAGRAFLPHAQATLDAVARGVSSARDVTSGSSGRLALRFTTMSALTVLPRAVADYQRRYPSVRVEIAPGGSVEQLEAIRAGRCDIGFMTVRADAKGLATEDLEREELCVFVGRSHSFAAREHVAFESCVRERLIVLREASEPGVRAAMRRRFPGLGTAPEVALEVDQIEAVLAFVAAGVGVAIMPGFVRRLRFEGVIAVPLRPVVNAGLMAVWDEKTLSTTARRFLEVVRAQRERGAKGTKGARAR